MSDPTSDRRYWVSVLDRIARPVLNALADRRLRRDMPLECKPDRLAHVRNVSHLEAVARLLVGIAPWLESTEVPEDEVALQADFRRQAVFAVSSIVDPQSPDRCNFSEGGQPLVDAAFLAQALVRAPKALLGALDDVTRGNLLTALMSTRPIVAGQNNWLLFAATVEAGIHLLGGAWDPVRIEYAFRMHDDWYKGDGAYGDGPQLHWDYYNSFVIYPMMLDLLDVCRAVGTTRIDVYKDVVPRRAQRYAAVQERLISPEGAIPPIGRSLAYRMGALQLLGQIALRRELPAEVSPAGVRCAMTAVMRRLIDAPGTFDERGWLRIGFCGHQPGLGEGYISTGSLYLCSTGLLPLGLPTHDPFWTAPVARWTSAQAYAGQDLACDHALTST